MALQNYKKLIFFFGKEEYNKREEKKKKQLRHSSTAITTPAIQSFEGILLDLIQNAHWEIIK